MSEQSAVAHSPGPAAPESATGSARAELLSIASLTAAAAIIVAAGGGGLVLLAKPIAGTIGVPGEVVGYITATAVLLGALTALVVPRLPRAATARAMSWAAAGAGAALVLAGFADGPILFTVGVLLSGAAVGPAHTVARIRIAAIGPRARAGRQAGAWLGLLAASLLGWTLYLEPGTGLVVTGLAATVVALAGVPSAAAARPLPDTAAPPRAAPAPDRGVPAGYGAAGFAVAAALTSAGYVLAHRWEVLGADQLPLVAAAAITAVLAVLLPPRAASAPLLLVVAAGGLLLVAIAPGPGTTAVGLAVTVAAAARAVAELDRLTAATGTIRTSAHAVGAGGAGLVAGYATSEVLREVTAAGTAITLTAFPVLVLTAAWIALAARRAPAPEGDPS